MIGKEKLKTRYYFELDGLRVATRYGYFDSEEEAKDFYTKNIKTLEECYSESVNDFLLIKEETFARRKLICRLSHTKYIIQCDSSIGELFVAVAMIDNTNMPYLSPLKSDAVSTNSFSSKEEAESIMEEYKAQLKPYYKESILNNMKVIEVEEG